MQSLGGSIQRLLTSSKIEGATTCFVLTGGRRDGACFAACSFIISGELYESNLFEGEGTDEFTEEAPGVLHVETASYVLGSGANSLSRTWENALILGNESTIEM